MVPNPRILWRATPGAPTFAYQVSGEYSMIMAAAMNGWIDGDKAMMEAKSRSSAPTLIGC